ncbi:MAG: DsbA family oxidoreductase [Flavobacteriales bacterium]|nr:DsbA family oxidoreductase [Flavobacteriales bacterium]
MENDPIGGPGQPLTIEVWSDVVCPFCYIGKRELEHALERFAHRDSVRVVWKSFELDPEAPARAEQDTYGMLSERYGMTREQARERVESVVQRAATVGLTYHFDRVIVGHSFDAHRLLQYAKSKGKGDGMKERLFKAYFTEGRHLADRATLVALATEVGLDAKEVDALLSTAAFTEAVRADEAEAAGLGISGVPFFVFDRRLAVSGAQAAEVFLQALQQAWDAR